jgi:hypothetical protein
MILEYGRWSDNLADQEEQRRVLADTYHAAAAELDTNPSGFVGAAVWWTLDDYWTQLPGVKIEHFGLYAPNGDPRPAGLQAAELFAGGAGQGAKQKIVSSANGQARKAAPALRFFGYLAYALVIALAIPATILLGLLVTRPRPRRMVRS